MRFPLNVIPNIPLPPNHGSFGEIRKYDIHTGVDLYAPDMTPVYAMTTGVVTDIGKFTGQDAGSEWWNETWYITLGSIKGSFNGKIVYGEIFEPQWTKGKIIDEGELIGYVKQVLKKDKGLPMSMLHMEAYDIHYFGEPVWWHLNEPRPECLIDPTAILQSSEKQES